MKKLFNLIGIIFCLFANLMASEADVGNTKKPLFLLPSSEKCVVENSTIVEKPSFVVPSISMYLREKEDTQSSFTFLNRRQRRAYERAIRANLMTLEQSRIVYEVHQQNKVLERHLHRFIP